MQLLCNGLLDNREVRKVVVELLFSLDPQNHLVLNASIKRRTAVHEQAVHCVQYLPDRFQLVKIDVGHGKLK